MAQTIKTNNKSAVMRVGPKHQITITKDLFNKLQISVGDFLEGVYERGGIFIKPKRLVEVERADAPSLTQKEQKLVGVVRGKIKRIQTNMINSRGLTEQEAVLGVKLGIIDKDQKWWWKEYWQKGEREAEKDIKEGRVKTFNNVNDLIADLNS